MRKSVLIVVAVAALAAGAILGVKVYESRQGPAVVSAPAPAAAPPVAPPEPPRVAAAKPPAKDVAAPRREPARVPAMGDASPAPAVAARPPVEPPRAPAVDVKQLLDDLGIEAASGALPAFTLEALDGRRLGLDDFRGRAVLMYFSTTWCPPCKQTAGKIEQLHREFKDHGFAAVAIDYQEARATVAAWAQSSDVSQPVLLDVTGDVTKQYDVKAFPTVFVVDRDGRLLGRVVGARDWTSDKGRALIQGLLQR